MKKLLGPLEDLEIGDGLEGVARGIAFQIGEALGVLERSRVAEEMKSISQEARGSLRKFGVRFGAYHLYLPALLKPAPRALAAQLWALQHGGLETVKGIDEVAHLASSGRTSFAADQQINRGLYRAAGFRVCGERAVRVDILERLADLIRPAIAYRPGVTPGEPPAGAADGDGFVVTVAMTSLAGCSGEAFAGILKSLGYASEQRPGPAITVALLPKASTEPVKVERPSPRRQPRPRNRRPRRPRRLRRRLAAEARLRSEAPVEAEAPAEPAQVEAEARLRRKQTAEAQETVEVAAEKPAAEPAEPSSSKSGSRIASTTTVMVAVPRRRAAAPPWRRPASWSRQGRAASGSRDRRSPGASRRRAAPRPSRRRQAAFRGQAPIRGQVRRQAARGRQARRPSAAGRKAPAAREEGRSGFALRQARGAQGGTGSQGPEISVLAQGVHLRLRRAVVIL